MDIQLGQLFVSGRKAGGRHTMSVQLPPPPFPRHRAIVRALEGGKMASTPEEQAVS